MKPFEDLLPEEEGNDLVGLLKEEDHTPLNLSPAMQEQIARRVRERLLQTSPDRLYDPGQIFMAPALHTPATLRQRLVRHISSLVAILVVGVIITSALLLFSPQKTIVSGPETDPVRAPATTHVQAGGFEMTLGITPGPYFIGEMLEVNITLTNHTSKTQWVSLPFGKSVCGYASGVYMQENLQPAFELPPTGHRCLPGVVGQPLQLLPGHTLSTQKYFVLQSSGSITLTSAISFLEPSNQWYQPVKGPLEGHWPTLHITVASQVPQDRQLTTHITGKAITIDVPGAAHLQYLFGISCTSGPGTGTEETGNYGWQPLKSTTVNRPACSMKHITWSYAIGSPGYAVATGNVQSDA